MVDAILAASLVALIVHMVAARRDDKKHVKITHEHHKHLCRVKARDSLDRVRGV